MADLDGEWDICYRLRKRAEIRRQAQDRKSVQEGQPDRLSNLLEEAADCIDNLWKEYHDLADGTTTYHK